MIFRSQHGDFKSPIHFVEDILHPCEIIYRIGGNNIIYGNQLGVCRITGKNAKGIFFNKWVKNTFNDHSFLRPGDIISNEALFCFDEKSKILQQKTGREKLQRFRTYSHIIYKGEWYCLTKSDKKRIFEFIVSGAEIICLTDTGQKHIFFKHKPGMWQLDDIFLMPDIPTFKILHSKMCTLLDMGFSQTEVITGNYQNYKLLKIDIKKWRDIESFISGSRGNSLFTFTSWLLFTSQQS